MPKFRVFRVDRTYETETLSGKKTGAYSDQPREWNVTARNAKVAEASARLEGSNFRVDEILSLSVRPFEEWRKERAARL